MKIRKAIVYCVLLAAAVAFYCYTHSDRAQIRRIFASIEKLTKRDPGETPIESGGKAQALAHYFAPNCEIIAGEYNMDATYSREDIAGGALAFRSTVKNISLVFSDLDISFDDGGAIVEGIADFSGTDAAWRMREPRPQKFIARLVKIDGKWLISRIKVP